MTLSVRVIGCVGLLGSSLLGQSIFADSQVRELQTISLTAEQQEESTLKSQALTKFAHDIMDVPFQKTHLSTEMLKQHDIRRIEESLNQVSGVFHQNNYGGGFWDNYSFRGFQGNPNLGADTIRNGLSVNRGISAPRDVVNIESMDFLKGPSAALYGRGEVGGVLNITTKQPTWQPKTEVNLVGSTLDEYRLSLEQSDAINNDVGYRMAIAVENNDSFRDVVNSKRLFIAPQLAWKPSDATEINLDTEFTQHIGTFDRGITAVNHQLVMDPTTFTGEPNDGDMRVKDYFYQLRLKHQINEAWIAKAALSYKDAQMVGYSTEPRKMQADLHTLERQRRHRDYQTEDVLLQGEVLGQVQFAGIDHEMVLGVETGHLDFMQKQYRLNHSTTQPNWINIYDPVYGQFSPDLPLHTDSDERQQYMAVNVQDQLFFNDKWNMLLGGRFEHVEQRFINHRTHLKDENTEQKLSPRLGINFRPTLAWSLYANYGEAFSMNNGMSRTQDTFAPETAKSYEVGAKYQWSDQSLLSLALFDMTKRNVLMTDVIDPNFEAAVGEVKSRGVELDIHHQFSDRIHFRAAYTYIDAKVSQDDVLKIGSPLTNIPKQTANLTANYDVWQSGSQAFGLHMNLSYVDARSGDSPTNTDKGFILPAYTLMNVGGYYQVNPQLRYQLNIHNLLNEDYYLSSYSNIWVQAGEPAKATFSIQWAHK